MNRKHIPIDGNVLSQKALSLCKNFIQGPLKGVTPSHLLQVRGGYRFRDRFGLKNVKIAGEATSAYEEAAATFPSELKKLRRKDTIQSKSSVVLKLGSSGRRCPIKPTFIKTQRKHQGIKLGRTD